jgi:ribA/ribD-fused uncharacterized protein
MPLKKCGPFAKVDHKDYLFFYGSRGEKGIYSQWHGIDFTTTPSALSYLRTPENEILFAGLPDLIEFTNAEQYMMLAKAIYFNDIDSKDQILVTTSPKVVKDLGRNVQGFSLEGWLQVREQIGEEGNWEKFRQNARLKKQLLSTGDKMIVEASSRDRVWGIGYEAGKALTNINNWGLNLLGKSLVKVRERLRALQSLEQQQEGDQEN